MNTLMKRVAMLGVAGLMTAGAAAPSLAQTVGAYVHTGPMYGHTYSGYAAPAGGYAYADPMSGYAYTGRVAVPYSVQQPSQCWTDEGYGRIMPCDTGSAQ
jgi:hypothetical protein